MKNVAWRPYGLSIHGLPIHPQLREDELLSSWLVRLAWANRMKVHSLCLMIAGNQGVIWNRDIDRLLPTWLQFHLERLTGVSAMTLRSAGLGDIARSLNGHEPNTNGYEMWLLPLGIWHRKRRGYGVQFCPLCLSTPKGQYVRRAWRLGFYTECEHHKVLLHDRCYACGAPFTYFRVELGRRHFIEDASMSTCAECGALLYRSPVERFEWPQLDHALATRTLLFMKDFGWAFVQNRIFPDSASLFRVLRQLITAMSSRGPYGQLYDAVAKQIWPEGYQVLGSRGKAFEQRGVTERHRLFGMAVWMMMDWPARFREVLNSSGIGCYAMVQGMRMPFPDWYADEYQYQLDHSNR